MSNFIIPKKSLTRIYRAEFKAWADMKTRCYNKKHKSHKNYGARGIRVCKRWYYSFQKFLEDMGPRPSNKYSLDRIDNNGHYIPSNCRWSTATQQMRNRRISHILTHNGRTMHAYEWAEKTGIKVDTIITRIRRGWTVEEALAGKAWECIHKGALTHTINGVTKTIEKWSIEFRINPNVVRSRIKKGWSVDDALTTPMKKWVKKN